MISPRPGIAWHQRPALDLRCASWSSEPSRPERRRSAWRSLTDSGRAAASGRRPAGSASTAANGHSRSSIPTRGHPAAGLDGCLLDWRGLRAHRGSPDPARECRRPLGSPLLVCDTDAFATQVWQRRYLGPESHHAATAAVPHHDVYLVTDHIDVPFVQDGLRDGEHIRRDMTRWFRRRSPSPDAPGYYSPAVLTTASTSPSPSPSHHAPPSEHLRRTSRLIGGMLCRSTTRQRSRPEHPTATTRPTTRHSLSQSISPSSRSATGAYACCSSNVQSTPTHEPGHSQADS